MTFRHSNPTTLPAPRRARRAWLPAGLGLVAVLLVFTACSGGEPEAPPPKPQPVEAAPPPPPGMSPEEAQAIMEPEPQGPVTEESIPEFRRPDRIEQPPPGAPAQQPPPGAPARQSAVAAPGAPAGAGASGTVRIAVLHGQGQEQAAIGVATVIDTYQQERLSKAVGRPLKVAYVSRVNGAQGSGNHVRYRAGMLKAALQLATVLPGDQVVEPMTPEDAAQTPVDVVIYLGAGMR